MVSDNSVIVTAPSVDEAIIVGLTRLTATRDEVDIEVLDEGSKGFLGIGMREAKVRVTRVDRSAVRAPEPAVEAVVPVAEPEPAEAPAAPVAETELEASAPAAEAAPAETATAEAAAAEAPAATPAPAPAATEPEPPAATSQPPAKPAHQRPARGAELDRAKLEAAARDVMGHLLPGLAVDVTIEWVEEERPTMWVSLDGRDADLLVGPRARNLHSIQYLFRALIYRQAEGDYNVVVDADGYRKRRLRSLESLAKSKADQAVETGNRVRLRAMPAHERRIIHMALRDDDRVSTESVGKGRDRAVTIIPKETSQSDKA